MEFDLSGITAYCIQDTDEGCFIFNSHGFVMEAEQMLELAKKLRRTALSKGIKKQLVEHNKNREIEIEKKWEEYRTKPKEQKPKKKGYVYLFECGGKYKIGYSIDVKRRVKELNRRPFTVNLIAVSKQTNQAFDKEQFLHSKLEKCRIDGEWYEFTQTIIDKIKEYIEGIE